MDSIALFFVILLAISWGCLCFYKKFKSYLAAYIIFEAGFSLWVMSIFFMHGWKIAFYGPLSWFLMGLGILISIILFLYKTLR